VFFQTYLAAPIVLAFYLFWKVWTRDFRLYVPVDQIDLTTGAKLHIPNDEDEVDEVKTWENLPKRMIRSLF